MGRGLEQALVLSLGGISGGMGYFLSLTNHEQSKTRIYLAGWLQADPKPAKQDQGRDRFWWNIGRLPHVVI